MDLPFKAIAAMSLNHVIGNHNKIPWHLPDDFKWFKQTTTGNVIIMGRKTFESIGRPLPNRLTVVLSRGPNSIPGVRMAKSLDELDPAAPEFAGKQLFLCGGAQVYAQGLPRCSDLFLTLVKREVQGDTKFPPFDHLFDLHARLMETPTFDILHYRRKPAISQTPPQI